MQVERARNEMRIRETDTGFAGLHLAEMIVITD
jgi:hypothetical protein